MKAFKQLNNRRKLSSRVAPFKRRSAADKAVSLSMVQSSTKVENACNQRGLEALNKGYKVTFVHG